VKNKQLFFLKHKVLMILICLAGTLGIGFMILGKPNASKAQSNSTIDSNDSTAEVVTQKRIEALKTIMLNSWQKEAQSKGIITDVPRRLQGTVFEGASLPAKEKVIALTFDDGPWPSSTAKIIDILQKNHIKGTFFVIGQNVKHYPDLLKRVVSQGNVIGNHTWHHWYRYLNPQAAAYEITSTADVIYKVTGIKTDLFRPPGGVMNNGVVNYAKNNKYAVILWSADSADYSRPSVSRLLRNVFRQAKPGGIVLMHDGGGNRSHTVQALPEVISRFREQGYRFVTIPELLELQDKQQKLVAKKKVVETKK